MKDLIDAINTRIKEPYWGFFLLSFLAFNWKGIFLLCFAGESAQVRINLFEQQTDLWSLIVCPISTAIFILLITPWLKLLFGWLSRRAYEKLNSQELEREHKYIAEKNKLEALSRALISDSICSKSSKLFWYNLEKKLKLSFSIKLNTLSSLILLISYNESRKGMI